MPNITDLDQGFDRIEKKVKPLTPNPWLDKEFNKMTAFGREPGFRVDDIPERLGLLHEDTPVSLSGKQFAKESIGAGYLAKNSVMAANIKARSITSDKVAQAAITASLIGEEFKILEILGALPAAGTAGRLVFLTTDGKIYRDNGTVWVELIMPADVYKHIGGSGESSIDTDQLVAGAVTVDILAANAVIADKIAANAVTAVKIAAGTITADEILAGTITAEELKIGGITTDRLAGGMSEDFEGLSLGNIHGQGSYVAWGTWVVTADANTQAHIVSGKWLYLLDNSAVGHVEAELSASSGNELITGVIEWEMRNSHNNRISYVSVRQGAAFSFAVWFNDDGNMEYQCSGGVSQVLQAYSASPTWYKIRVHFDCVSRYCCIFIDDAFNSRQSLAAGAAGNYIDRIQFYTDDGDAVGLAIDNLKVYNVTV